MKWIMQVCYRNTMKFLVKKYNKIMLFVGELKELEIINEIIQPQKYKKFIFSLVH